MIKVFYEYSESNAGVKDSDSHEFQHMLTFCERTKELLKLENIFEEKHQYSAPDRAYGYDGYSKTTQKGCKANDEIIECDYKISESVVNHGANQQHWVGVDGQFYDFINCPQECASHYGEICDCDSPATWNDVNLPYWLKMYLTDNMNEYYSACSLGGETTSDLKMILNESLGIKVSIEIEEGFCYVMPALDGFWYKGRFIYFGNEVESKKRKGQQDFTSLVLSNSDLLPKLLENKDFKNLLYKKVEIIDTWIQVVGKVASPVKLIRMALNVQTNAYWNNGKVLYNGRRNDADNDESKFDKTSCCSCNYNPTKNTIVFPNYSFVSVIDSSKGTEHWIPVPPNMKSAKAAIAWTFNMTAEEYVVAKNS